jgi:hypothetical protein
MTTRLSRLFAVSSLCLLIGIGLSVSYFVTRSFSSTELHQADPPGNPVKEIAGYRGWAKVNTEPQLMPDPTALLCAQVIRDGTKNPHNNKYLTVYVNDVGRQAMYLQLTPKFPEGSVIVKEKLPEKSSQTPELLTVMIKHGKGFNPASGDWEFMVVDGTGTKVLAQGKLENCQLCHTTRSGTDYVFRTYLPSEVHNQLK